MNACSNCCNDTAPYRILLQPYDNYWGDIRALIGLLSPGTTRWDLQKRPQRPTRTVWIIALTDSEWNLETGRPADMLGVGHLRVSISSLRDLSLGEIAFFDSQLRANNTLVQGGLVSGEETLLPRYVCKKILLPIKDLHRMPCPHLLGEVMPYVDP